MLEGEPLPQQSLEHMPPASATHQYVLALTGSQSLDWLVP